MVNLASRNGMKGKVNDNDLHRSLVDYESDYDDDSNGGKQERRKKGIHHSLGAFDSESQRLFSCDNGDDNSEERGSKSERSERIVNIEKLVEAKIRAKAMRYITSLVRAVDVKCLAMTVMAGAEAAREGSSSQSWCL